MYRIESFLSARLFLQPRLAGDRLYFISNLSGRLSLYVMDTGGSVPEPLLPPQIALQNPHLLEGEPYCVFEKAGKIVLMLDRDGDENYQPVWIPLQGGYPQPVFGDAFNDYRLFLIDCDPDKNLVYLSADSRKAEIVEAYQGNIETGELLKLGESPYGCNPLAIATDHSKFILCDQYTIGDQTLYLRTIDSPQRALIFGTPLDARQPGQSVPLCGFRAAKFIPGDRAVLLITSLFEDSGGLGILDLEHPETIRPVEITGAVHQGIGELTSLKSLSDQRYLLGYNIDGCDWYYEGVLDTAAARFKLERVICGVGQIANGVVESIQYDRDNDRFALAFSSATSPTQLYTIEGKQRQTVRIHTRERILGIPQELLSPGEDASYISFDGQRVSARLYLPSEKLGFTGPRPLVYYVHGGPQSQERPDFAWFSMPLIQFLTLNGFAVFVPNVRGSTGYGLQYTKQVDRDWGGKDRLDHVHAMTVHLPRDARLDCTRAGVVGRSYGGYMTLMLAGCHPELWKAAVDMFGPYDLLTFFERIPETWKPYYRIALGDPSIPAERQFLIERSPRTHLPNLACPLLVIQGRNDPRVVERESSDLVADLRSQGKQIEYLMFENEGHDVLKFENRVTCYNAITDFFIRHLNP